MKSSLSIWHLLNSVKSTEKILSYLVAFLKYINLNLKHDMETKAGVSSQIKSTLIILKPHVSTEKKLALPNPTSWDWWTDCLDVRKENTHTKSNKTKNTLKNI